MSKRFIYCIVLLKLIEEAAAYLPGMGRAGGQRRPPPTRPVQGVVVVVMPRIALICPITCTVLYCTVLCCTVLYCPPHHVPDEVDEEVLYQAALPHLPLLLGGGGAGQSRGGEEAEAQENGL